LTVVCRATSPRHSTLAVQRGVTSSPNSDLETHWCLRIIASTDRIRIIQRPYQRTIDIPLCLVALPIHCIIVQCGLCRTRRNPYLTIITRSVPLPKIIGLHLVRRTTDPLPIYLIEIIAFENDGRYDSCTGCRFEEDAYDAEEDVEVCLDGGCVAGFANCESGAAVTVAYERRARCGVPV
jgi:hypothetical protein